MVLGRDQMDIADPIGGPVEFYQKCAEQIKTELALRVADRAAFIEKGRIVWRGAAGEFCSEPTIAERFLHVGGALPPAGV